MTDDRSKESSPGSDKRELTVSSTAVSRVETGGDGKRSEKKSRINYVDRADIYINGRKIETVGNPTVHYAGHKPSPASVKIRIDGRKIDLGPDAAYLYAESGARSEEPPAGWNAVNKVYERFHPIKFAQYAYCLKCDRLVTCVETNHDLRDPLVGPWTVKTQCHGQQHVVELSKEAVEHFVSGRIQPVVAGFFGGPDGKAEPRPLTAEEATSGVKRGQLNRSVVRETGLLLEDKR